MTHLFVHLFCPLVGSDYHLRQDRLLLLEVGQLFLEVAVLLLLTYHAQLQSSVQRLDEGSCRLNYLLVNILDLGLHRVQILPVQLDQLVVLLQILVGLPRQILGKEMHTSTKPRCPVA